MRVLPVLLLLAFCATAQERTGAVMILPFQGQSAEQVDLGIGIHNLLENMLLQHGGLDETWVLNSYRTLFPTYRDLEGYRLGRGQAKGLETLSPRWVVTGRVVGDRLALTVVDRATGMQREREMRFDPPAWLGVRREFAEVLVDAGVPWNEELSRGMTWREDLPFDAMRHMGAGLRSYIEVMIYEPAGRSYESAPLERAAGQESYLAVNNLGWAHYQRGQYEAAEKRFRQALESHGEGIDALDGVREIGLQRVHVAMVREALTRKARARQQPSITAADWLVMAERWEKAGDNLKQPGNERYYRAALEMAQAAADRGKQGTVLRKLGDSFRVRQDYTPGLPLLEQALSLLRAVGDRAGQAATLMSIGLVYSALGDKQKALGFYNEALPLYRGASDRAGEAATLISIGGAYSALGDKQKALGFYNEALPLYRAVGDRAGEAVTLTGIGGAYSALGDKQKALGYYNEALPLYRAVVNRVGEAATLISIGSAYLGGIGGAYSALEDNQKALGYYNEALPLYRAVGNRAGEAATLTGIGGAYSASGDKQKALRYYNEALPLYRAVGDRAGEAVTLTGIGGAYSALGDKQKALGYYNQALPLRRAVGNRAGEATTLNSIGLVYAHLGEKQKALEYLNEALQLHRAVGNRAREAAALNGIGLVYAALGEKQKALGYYNEALQLDRTDQATTLSNIGLVYSGLGENQKALGYYNEALPLHRAVGNRTGEATMLNSIGLVYAHLGEKQKALGYLNEALRLHRAVGDRGREAAALNNIGTVHSGLGEKQKAIRYYNEALRLHRAVGDRAGEAAALNNIGSVYFALGKHQKALEYCKEALSLHRAVGDRSGEASTLHSIGTVYSALGEQQKALGYYNEALSLLRAVGDRAWEAATLNDLADLHRPETPRLAIWYGKQAVNVYQSLRRDTQGLDSELRLSYDRTVEGSYRRLADLLIDEGRLVEGQQVMDLLKEKEAFDRLRRDKVAEEFAQADLTPRERTALAEYRKIESSVIELGNQRAALLVKQLRSQDEETELTALARRLSEAELVTRSYLERLRKEFVPRSTQDERSFELGKASALQSTLQALGPETVALYTLVAENRVLTMLVTAGSRKVHVYPIARKEVNRKVKELRQALEDPSRDPLPLEQEAYHIIFSEGLRDELDKIGAKNILWSLDGTLRYVPVAVLHDGKQYLGQIYQHALMTPDTRENLLLAVPEQWTGVGFGASRGGDSFQPLPAVTDELRGIFKQRPEEPQPVTGTTYVDEKFTESELVRAGRRVSVVHLASHFESLPGDTDNSKLLLGDGRTLSMLDLASHQRLFSGVSLLTLSACQTGLAHKGDEDGREVDSLANVGQQLGAHAVLASLWSVNDRSTALFMQEFYRVRQQERITKAEALRRAQAAMIEGRIQGDGCGARKGMSGRQTSSASGYGCDARRPYAHPYYWAPFVLMGNSK